MFEPLHYVNNYVLYIVAKYWTVVFIISYEKNIVFFSILNKMYIIYIYIYII